MSDTPGLRFDAWTDSWVLVAPGRFGIGAMRPAGLPSPGARCPFCPGHEGDTEPSTESLGAPWRARSVLNRFPLVRSDAELPDELGEHARAALGVHEVIIESRHHDRDLADMSATEALDVLTLWRARSRALGALPSSRAIALFRNKGRRAGSSQPHPHSQIVALPFVPPQHAARARAAREHHARARGPWVQHLIERERRDGLRIVRDADGVVSFCPYASPRAWWARLLVDADVPRFADADDALLRVLAERVRALAACALKASGATDYNVYVADPPLGEGGGFAIEVVPRTGGDAGFELSTGTSVCVVSPEDAAAKMRSADLSPASC